MFYGHPLERLCTYQYSLVTLMPGGVPLLPFSTLALTFGVGLLQHLEDCGSPPLATRAPALTRPTSLKTSDHKSMIAYLGLPLDLFGKVSGTQLMKNPMHELPYFIGCFLSTIPSPATAGHDQRDQKLVVRDYKLYRRATKRSRPLCGCESNRPDDNVRFLITAVY